MLGFCFELKSVIFIYGSCDIVVSSLFGENRKTKYN